MNSTEFKNSIRTVGRAILTILCWIIVQGFVLIAIGLLNLFPSYLFHIYPPGTHAVAITASLAHYYAILVVIYTIVGVILLNMIPINTRRWWVAVGICYGLFMLLTTAGMIVAMKDWFWYGFGVLVLDVWLGPLLWLGEIEIVHLLRTRKRNKQVQKS